MKFGHFFVSLCIIKVALCDQLIDACDNTMDNENKPKTEVIYGEYKIVALLPVTSKVKNKMAEYNGIQMVEAALFALDIINSDKEILPNITLGIDIVNYCNVATNAVAGATFLMDELFIRSNKTPFQSSTKLNLNRTLIGVIEPGYRFPAFTDLKYMLRYLGIVQVSYSEPFEDPYQESFPLAFSVVPGIKGIVGVVLKLLDTYSWSFVSIIYHNDTFGRNCKDYFHQIAHQNGICVAESNSVDITDTQRRMKDYAPSYEKVDAIICFCSSFVINSFAFNKSVNSTRKIMIISSDGSMPEKPKFRNEYQTVEITELRISFNQPQEYAMKFDNYFVSRSLKNNVRNPWFGKFWESNFGCLINASSTAPSSLPRCSGEESLGLNYKRNSQVPSVMKSVFLLAHLLHNFLNEKCSRNTFSNEDCYEVNFNFFGENVTFVNNLLTPTRVEYNIHQLKELSNGSKSYVLIGNYVIDYINRKKNESLKIIEKVQFELNKSFNKFLCNQPCPRNHERIFRDDQCCWDCYPCGPLEILSSSLQCVPCDHMFIANNNKTKCISAPIKLSEWDDKENLISLSLSSLCIALITFTAGVFTKYKDTPAVKSSTLELCYIMFVGMILANVTSFVVILPLNELTCSAITTIPAIGFTMMYAPLLVKTNRVARLLAMPENKFPNMNPKFSSVKAQVILTAMLITVQICICLYSLLKYRSKPVLKFYDDVLFLKMVCPLDNHVVINTYAFVSLLAMCYVYYALKTKKLPEHFNETKFIGFAMFAGIICDILFEIMYLDGRNHEFVMNLYTSVNCLMLLIFSFCRKLYIILLRPEKNTKANFSTSIRYHVGKVDSLKQ